MLKKIILVGAFCLPLALVEAKDKQVQGGAKSAGMDKEALENSICENFQALGLSQEEAKRGVLEFFKDAEALLALSLNMNKEPIAQEADSAEEQLEGVTRKLQEDALIALCYAATNSGGNVLGSARDMWSNWSSEKPDLNKLIVTAEQKSLGLWAKWSPRMWSMGSVAWKCAEFYFLGRLFLSAIPYIYHYANCCNARQQAKMAERSERIIVGKILDIAQRIKSRKAADQEVSLKNL